MPAHDIFAAAAWIAMCIAAVSSVLFLRTRNFRYDAIAVAVTEVGLAFLGAYLVTGCLRTHAESDAWWTWNAHLTAGLVCWLTYAAYLMLRQAIEEPTGRATFAAVVSIFAFVDIPIVIFAVGVWRKPTPFWTSENPAVLAAILLLGAAITAARFRQEELRREIDHLRRTTHTL